MATGLGDKLDSLSLAFKHLTNVGLRDLLQRLPTVGSLDLEGNIMEFNLESEGVNLLWKEGSNLHHLNASCDAFTY